jgi:DNA-binding transcriptional MocR family regulator
VVLLYGLVKNIVQPDLELSFLLNAPQSWLEALDIGAELTYSRIAYPSQHYYEWLFDDLLSFTFARDPLGTAKVEREESAPLSELTRELCADPVFAAKPISLELPDLIRLDYGEFEHAVPDALVKGLFRGFLEDSPTPLLTLMLDRVCQYLRATRRATVEPNQIVLAQGVFALFGGVIAAMKDRLNRAPRIAVPKGSYGPIYPLVKYHGGELIEIDTDAKQGFNLESHLEFAEKPDLLWLTQPANPSGFFMDSQNISAVLSYCAENGIYVLADEIFFLLSDVRMGQRTSPDLSFASRTGAQESRFLFVADGIAKSFAAGGMRCGFLRCPDQEWRDEIQSRLWIPPQSSLRAWDSLYFDFLDAVGGLGATKSASKSVEARPGSSPNQSGIDAHAFLQSVRALLSQQRGALLELLRKHGVDDGRPNANRGGLFVLARLDDESVRLAEEQHLLINPGAWARIPGWARICIGLPQDRFEQALDRLDKFLKSGRK